MSVLEIILVFYVLPLLVSSGLRYYDGDVITLGDWLQDVGYIIIPIFNIIYIIAGILYILDNHSIWEKIKNIKIKSLIIIFSSFLLFSCANAEQRIKEYSYTQKWHTIDSLRFQVYKTKSGREYIIILNERETKFVRKYIKTK